MKLLTITVPGYNVEKTLGATLDSLCVEEVLPALDIIVVDDGSSDGTAAIAGSYAEKYPDSVRVISKSNGGHGSAVNAGIAAARGRYFKVVDGDDRLERDGLIALVNRIKDSDCELIASNYRKVSPDGANVGDMNFCGIKFDRKYNFSQIPTDGSIYFGIHSSTFKTEILQKNNIRLQEHTFYVDTEYALLPIPFVNTVEFLDKCVYLYTVGSAQQSIDAKNFVKRYDDHLRVVKRLVEFADGLCADKPHTDYIYSVLGKLCFTQYMLAAFYDDNASRGKKRAREFDGWLKGSAKLYSELGGSLYIRFMRATGFKILPRGAKLKAAARAVFSFAKRLTGKKKLTY